MTVEPRALAQLVSIIDRIYAGHQAPRIAGRFGQYLRLCHSARAEVQHLLAREGIAQKVEGWWSGNDLGEIALTPIGELRSSVPSELWGPVEHVPALCEQLGFVIDLTLWTSARAANRAHVLLAQSASQLRFRGAYRWFAPSRITPGDATVEPLATAPTDWRTARFVKATADDLGRAPHPLEYILDYRLGPPGLKVFRNITAQANRGGFMVLPGFRGETSTIRLETKRASALRRAQDGDLVSIVAFREPWSEVWTAVEAWPATPSDCLAHAITWADFQAEIRYEPPLMFGDVEAARASLATVGLDPSPRESLGQANLERQLLAGPRALVRWLRYRT